MLIVVLVAFAVLGVWCVVSLALAVLAGGVIHARDHRDLPPVGPSAQPVAAR